MLYDSVSSSPSDVSCASGVSHLEFSVLHRRLDTVFVDAGLSSTVPHGQGRGSIATRFKASSRFLDSLGAIVARGRGNKKLLCVGPGLRGVFISLARIVSGVGGKRARCAFLGNKSGV